VRAALLLAAGALALGAAGCGLGAGKGAADVSLLVSGDFGRTVIGSSTTKRTAGADTVMRLVERRYKVTTRYGGGFVQSIDGRAGGTGGGHRVDWFYYVNGVEASKGAAATHVHPGDRVWWDRHAWDVTDHIPAVVGSFPEPFRHGIGGKRAPVGVQCAEAGSSACKAVTKALVKVGVPAATAALGSETGQNTLRVLVGTFAALRTDTVLGQLRSGPRSSGVYARPEATGLALLNAEGKVVRTLGPGAGLVAASQAPEQLPTWVIGGVNEAGVDAAAAAFDARDLDGHFAVAVSGGEKIPVPLP
jgi:hypothetical protein